MSSERNPTNLEELHDCIRETAEDCESVSLDNVLDVVGRRSFGPFLLLAGLVMLAPGVGDIPGVPTTIAVFVVVITGQVLFRQQHLWLPRWLLDRCISRDKLLTGLKWLRRPARVIDRFLRPRLMVLMRQEGIYAIAIVCTLLALATPIMEIVPFSANAGGTVLTLFGLALIAHDGLFAIAGHVLAGVTVGLIAYFLI